MKQSRLLKPKVSSLPDPRDPKPIPGNGLPPFPGCRAADLGGAGRAEDVESAASADLFAYSDDEEPGADEFLCLASESSEAESEACFREALDAFVTGCRDV